jgi:hypothetical protein
LTTKVDNGNRKIHRFNPHGGCGSMPPFGSVAPWLAFPQIRPEDGVMSQQPRVQLPTFKIHTRTGAIQFTLQPAFFAGDSYKTQAGEIRVMKKGYVMVEMANAADKTDSRGNMVYDWPNKISMKLSEVDIQQVIDGLRGKPCKIVHDPNKARGGQAEGQSPKSVLFLNKGEQFGFFMTLSRGEKKAKCPVGDLEAANLRLLLSRAIARIYAW